MSEPQPPVPNAITSDQIAAAAAIAGLDFTEEERELMLEGVDERRAAYEKLRTVALANDVIPAIRFDPELFGKAPLPSYAPATTQTQAAVAPDDLEALAFWPVSRLAELIRTRQVSSLALTEMYLERLKRYDPILQCVITRTEDLARAQAQRADAEIAAGRYRGPLHGIPWGAKDLLAVKGYPTTWGAAPFKDQVIDQDATVVRRLDQAGAVLVAKLSMGALAWGDVWFGGTTKTPWNVEEGSSGSSAGPGSATAAGLLGFSIGTETWGSIVSPSTQCGVTGLRPTFGRVSRHGAMALSWTMDKIGPMCRTVEDCALVFDAIHGPDGCDPTVVARPFVWPPDIALDQVRVGVVSKAFEMEYPGRENDLRSLDGLRTLGVDLIPIELPAYPIDSLDVILQAEAAAAFDDLTRSDRDDLLVRQVADAWPNVMRQARLIPAVEYIQANRVRALLMQEMAQLMQDVDVTVAPSFAGDNLLLTNLTGHPSVTIPNGFGDKGVPTSITFTGRLFDEATLLLVAQALQTATDFHGRHPTLSQQ